MVFFFTLFFLKKFTLYPDHSPALSSLSSPTLTNASPHYPLHVFFWFNNYLTSPPFSARYRGVWRNTSLCVLPTLVTQKQGGASRNGNCTRAIEVHGIRPFPDMGDVKKYEVQNLGEPAVILVRRREWRESRSEGRKKKELGAGT